MAAGIVLNRSDRVYELSMRGNARENPLSSFRRSLLPRDNALSA